ncbi:PBECR3 domain-containing polyvalent protein [Helicobacter pylori]|uniref:PBECR3 domain-containing polyvalent protein n=2 Tax=Helicobacter pylori TaxID=210 RepID=UPI0002BC064F|nr:hypothetical protein BZK23_07635 [Helicobacter pylori]
MIIEKASNKELELLKDANFKQNIRASLDHEAIAHILKRHGVNSVNVRNGEIPVTNEDIANYRYIINNADAIIRTIDKYNQEAITAFKQINGYAVVVEQAINKKNELALKTMYKNNGSYKNNDVYKEFSSTSLDANAKVPHGLSSHSGATENITPKPLNSQEDLLKRTENLNETTQEVKNLSPLEQANAEKLAKLETEKGITAEAVKKLDFDEIKKLIDESPRTGSSMPILGVQNFTAEAVEYIQKNHKRIAVEKIEPSFAKDLQLKYPDDARAVIDHQAINHILKEHKNLAYEDIANYRELSKQANETLKLKDNQNRPVVASFNQINGFFVVVEQVSNSKNELMLKTMYKARGNYKDSLIYKKTLAKSQNSN